MLKKGGNSTPSPTWKVGSFDFQTNGNKDSKFPNFNITTTKSTCVSARKLGAFLWEALPPHTTEEKMIRDRRHKGKEKGLAVRLQIDSAIDSPYEEEAPRPSHSSLKREIAALLIQHHRSVQRNSCSLQPVVPASYKSSTEVTPFYPLSHLRFQGVEGKIGNSHFHPKTSNELVLVLNRIWTLEEQHASNISLVNSMKRELDQYNLQIKKLLLDKNKEQERVKDTIIKPLKEELEVERKLRKQSESLHKKLARELLDTKTSFADTLKQYKEDKKAKNLLESLCDEFAKGIRDYEQEVRYLKQKPDKKLMNRKSPDKLTLHISKAWLDERMQMKQVDTSGRIADKLSVEIETFLQGKATKHCLKGDKLSLKKPIGGSFRRHSSVSFHLNEAMSAPHNVRDDDDSTSSDSKYIQSHLKDIPKLKTMKKVCSRKKQGKVEGVGDPPVNSNSILDNLIRNQILSLEEETPREDNQVYISKATSKWAHGLKESTLKEKLLEARLEGQH